MSRCPVRSSFSSSFLLASLPAVLSIGAACSGGSGFPDAAVEQPPQLGRFSVSWTIADGERALTCNEVGALVISTSATSADFGNGYSDAFTCGSGTAVSRALRAGLYDISFELKAPGGSLGTVMATGVRITADAVTTTPPLRFPVTARGSIESRLIAGVATSNCGPAGANISAMSLVLEKGGVCVPATFTIGAGATAPAATYDSTCATPPPAPCIERDQAVTATVGSGSYVLRLRGNVGTAPCWAADQLVDVPAAERLLRVDVGLAYLTGANCP